MEYAYRTHNALIELDPGETGEWLLPPATRGRMIIKSYYAMPPGWKSSTEGGTTRRARPIGPRGGGRWPFPGRGLGDGIFDPGTGPGEGGGSFGQTLELDLELFQVGHQVATGNGKIDFDAQHEGDIWALRIKRRDDGSLERRRYRIEAQYYSVLPMEERRIPMGFFTRGFDLNWNAAPAIKWVELEDNCLVYEWNSDFARLYGKPTDNLNVPLSVGPLDLPNFKSIDISLGAGIAPDPMPELQPQGYPPRPDFFYFSLMVNFEYAGAATVEIEIPVLPNKSVKLPNPLWFEARFYLETGSGGTITYVPKVFSPLLDALDVNITYPDLAEGTKTVNVKDEVVKKLEDHLYKMQFEHPPATEADPHPAGFQNVFDKYLRPYLVGRYEVTNIHGDAATNELVISYVGRQQPRLGFGLDSRAAEVLREMLATSADPSSEPATDTSSWPRLYDTPFEMLLPRIDVGPGSRRVPQKHDPGALSKIEHIVVLMQENRSFDQVLGYLSREGLLARDQLLDPATRASSETRELPQEHVNGLLPNDNDRDAIRYPDQAGGQVYRSKRTNTTAWPSFSLDGPCHGHSCVERQISDGMKGFIADYARKRGMGPAEYQLIMNYYTDAELPAYGALTREFAICDAWFCSHIGGTLPNRFISLTGDFSEDVYGSPELENPDLAGGFAPLETATFFDHLTEQGVSWKLFEHNYSMLRLIRKYTFDEVNIAGFKDEANGFAATVAKGLPQVTFIEPDYIEMPNGNDDHAPANMRNGQRLVATIMDALLSKKEVWEKTLFIITYDEHGGFYDHEPLPSGANERPPLATGETRPGVRVPAFVISPYVEAMSNGNVNVAKAIYEHTTIPATILRRFCANDLPVMSPRVTGANDLRDLLTRDEPRPYSDFDRLREEMRQIATWPEIAPDGGETRNGFTRKPATASDLEDDFAGLIAFSSSITGMGRS